MGTSMRSLLLADDDEDYLLRRARQAVTRIHERRVARVVAIEPGRILRNAGARVSSTSATSTVGAHPLFLASDSAI